MSFNQQGPPASAKQVAYIQSLLRKAGYDDFRTARTEYRLTQRQARGKFTKTEASVSSERICGPNDRRNPLRIESLPTQRHHPLILPHGNTSI